MSVAFGQPLWLWALAVLVPMVWASAWFGGMSRARWWSAVGLRVALVGMLVGLAAWPSSVRRVERVAVVAVVDVSGSVLELGSADEPTGGAGGAGGVGGGGVLQAVRARLSEAAGARGPDDLVGVVVVGERAVAVASPAARPASAGADPRGTAVIERAWEAMGAVGGPDAGAARAAALAGAGGGGIDGTDLAAGLSLAAAMLPADALGRVVVFSDGVQTSGDVLGAARRLAWVGGSAEGGGRAAGVPVDVVPIGYRPVRDVRVEAIDVPSRASPGAVVTARVRLSASGPSRGVLRLVREGEELDISGDGDGDGGGVGVGRGRAVSLRAGENVVLVDVALPAGRVHRFEAVFEPEGDSDALERNNRAEGITLTPGAGSVLVLDGGAARDAAGSAALVRAIEAAGARVEVRQPEGVPTGLLELQSFDAVVLNNAPLDRVGTAGDQALTRYVTQTGGGLVVIGGPEALSPGGWRGSAMEAVLPVRLDLPERLVVPSAAVVLVLDTSGSMGWTVRGSLQSQQEIANRSAAMAVKALDPSDLIGVVAFNNSAEVVVPLGRNTEADQTAAAIMRLSPDGGTNIPPALEMAYAQIRDAEAPEKHVIVLSDGISRNKEALSLTAARMRRDGIKVTAIAVGDGADADGLERMASAGGGAFYRVVDPGTLPLIFLRAVRVVRSPHVREEPFVPVVSDAGSPALVGVASAGPIPALGGLVLTEPRETVQSGVVPESAVESQAQLRSRRLDLLRGGERATGVVYALVSPDGEPVLAHWRAGLGQVAVFTSDAGPWSAQWRSWAGWGRLWGGVMQAVSRGTASGGELRARVVSDRVEVTADALDAQGAPRDGVSLRATVFGPGGDRRDVPLAQVGPGRYEGSAPAPVSGSYVVTAVEEGAAGGAPMISAALRASGEEYRAVRPDRAVLEQLAAETGGRVLELGSAARPGWGARLMDREGLGTLRARRSLWEALLPWVVVVLLLDVATRRVAWDRLIGSGELAWLAARGQRAAARSGRGLDALRKRQQVPGQPVPAALGSEAAAAIRAKAEAERRARRQRGAPTVPAANAGAPAESVDPAEGQAVWLAAKKRARERFEGE